MSENENTQQNAQVEDKPVYNPPEAASKKFVWKNGKKSINYTACAEALPVYDYDSHKLIGHQFMLSYVADNPSNKEDRPVTFLWNGGPGGSSAMVNIGGLGPHRVPTVGTEHLTPTAKFEDNPYTLLQESDLIFLDAFGTGYSHVDPAFDKKKVWGVDGDGASMASGIAAWLQEHNRWHSPLYLYGESYGTMRNAVVYRILGERGIGVTGVVEQSSILDYAPTLSGNDAYYMGMLPLYATAAQHFKKAGKGFTVKQWWDKAFDFVYDTYASALIKGDSLSEDKVDAVAKEMSELIGLDKDFIKQCGLRIELDTFRLNILADEGKTCGRYDMRFTTYKYKPVQDDNEFFAGEDPSMDAINSPYQGAYLDLLQEIGFKGDPNYDGLNITVNEDWDWTHQAPGTMGSPQTPDVAFDISTALRRNPKSRILFFGGYYDAATPFWNVKHDMDKLWLPKELKDRIEYHVHENGHMAYAATEALEKMAPELHDFYEKRHED